MPGAGPLRSPASVVAAGAAVVAVLAAAACGGDGGGDAERFCGEVQANTAAILAPEITTEAELDATVDLYRRLADLAPAAISEEWDAILVNIETASTVVPSDPESMQRAVAQAFATERSAVVVRDWLLANCAIDLGPVATVTPQGQVSVPPSPTTAPGG